ncbi:hypothetical protein IC582_029208 [Cucumis melo]
MKGQVALSWLCFRWQETLGLVGGAEHKESKAEMNQGSLPVKSIGEESKDGACKVNRVPIIRRDPPRKALKWNFKWMQVSNPSTEMSSRFLGIDEWPATLDVRRAKGPRHS